MKSFKVQTRIRIANNTSLKVLQLIVEGRVYCKPSTSDVSVHWGHFYTNLFKKSPKKDKKEKVVCC